MNPCFTFSDWLTQVTAILGKTATIIFDTELSGETAAANIEMLDLIPSIDSISSEYRALCGKPSRPDTAPE
jgi:hypothetical protein